MSSWHLANADQIAAENKYTFHKPGWRITSNTESDAYMDDVNNIAYVSLGAVQSRDDSCSGSRCRPRRWSGCWARCACRRVQEYQQKRREILQAL